MLCSFPSLDALGDADVDVLSDFREPTGEMKGGERVASERGVEEAARASLERKRRRRREGRAREGRKGRKSERFVVLTVNLVLCIQHVSQRSDEE